MQLTKTQQMYISQKRILDILESGNIHDERYKLLLQGLTVEDVIKMREFIAFCEDTGIPLTIKKESN